MNPPSMPARWLAALALAACNLEAHDPGTSVGNPGDAALDASPTAINLAPIGGATEVTGELQLVGMSLTPCGTGPVTTLDLHQPARIPSALAFEIPGGHWCGITLDIPDPVLVEGVASGDARFQLLLNPGRIVLESPDSEGLRVHGQTLVLELARSGWLDVSALGIPAGGLLVVDEGHPLHQRLSQELAGRSTLYFDIDRNGTLTEEERGGGPLLEGTGASSQAAEPDSTGSDGGTGDGSTEDGSTGSGTDDGSGSADDGGSTDDGGSADDGGGTGDDGSTEDSGEAGDTGSADKESKAKGSKAGGLGHAYAYGHDNGNGTGEGNGTGNGNGTGEDEDEDEDE